MKFGIIYRVRLLFITALIVLLALECQGQGDNYYFRSYSVSDGLPSNHVRWITQDKDGFLWLATWDGLARFDGVEFKTYRHDPNDSTSLVYFEVIKVVVDSSNQVWIFSAGKLCRYERNLDHFRSFSQSDFLHYDPEQGPPYFSDMMVDSDGRLIVVFANAFYRFNDQNEKFEYIYGQIRPSKFFNPSLSSIDNLGNLWYLKLDAERELGQAVKYRFNDQRAISAIDSFPFEMRCFRENFTNETVHIRIHINPEGKIWMTTSLGLLTLENDTFRLAEDFICPAGFPDADLLMWSQHSKGLMIYYPSEQRIDTLFEPGKIETVIAYYHDSQDNIWFGDMSNISVRNGLNLTFRTRQSFRHYLTRLEQGNPHVIYGLCKDRSGNIWTGGRPNDHIIKISPEGNETHIPVPFSPILYYNVPRNIIPDKNGNIWISFFYKYLYRFNPQNNEFTDFSWIAGNSPGKYSYINIRLIHQMESNLMVAAGGGKIYIFNPQTREVKASPMIDDRDIFCIYHDKLGRIWFGLSGKLFTCDVRYENQKLYHISDLLYNVEDICAGDGDDLWLALLGGGIGHFDTGTGKIIFYTTYNGLAHNTVYSIIKDRSGNLWMSHDLGISMFNPVTKSFTNYDEKDGLRIREFDSEAAFQTEQGEILFGGIGGIVSFYPDSVRIENDKPYSRIIISEFRVSNKFYPLPQSSDEIRSIILPKGTDNFQLEFVKPDYRNGDEIRYRYILKGSQSDWTTTDSKHRRVNFTSLRPGNYEFLAAATDLKGEWAYQTGLIIDIPPYFYQTLFFKILLVLIAASVFIIYFIMKTKQIRLTEKKKQEQLRLETLRGQMNPHFIYNSLNSINYFISLNDRLNANQYITDFSRLMRAIMINSSQDYILLESEIQALKDYLALEHLRFSDKFDYRIEIDDRIDQGSVEVTPSLVQPFVENAIWHGLRYLENRKGFLSVRFIMKDNLSLVCFVEDDGVGRKLSVKLKSGEQKKRRSRGISIVEDRLVLINSFQKSRYTINVSDLYEDQEETGTRVRIELPFRIS